MEMNLYHGSLHKNIETFNPFSHFGSKLAATDAAYRRIHLGEEGFPTLYKVSISLPQENSIELSDWVSPRPRDLAEALSAYFQGQLSEKFESIVKSISIRDASDSSLRLSLFKKISDQLLPDVRGIYYKNEHEGEFNELTLCLVSPACVSSIENVEFDHDQVEKVKTRLSKKYPRLQQY